MSDLWKNQNSLYWLGADLSKVGVFRVTVGESDFWVPNAAVRAARGPVMVQDSHP